MNILIVEDNSRISEFVVKGLEENHFSVILVENGTDARRMITEKEWDLILLDIMLPDIDGIGLLQFMRYKKVHTPVLVMSALSDPEDKIKALDYGADGYLTKPFLFRELLAHINALTRRARISYTTPSEVLACDNLTMEIEKHLVKRGERELTLTLQEFKLLKILLENKDKVMSCAQLLNDIWGVNYDPNTNIVDVYISYLRNKVDTEEDNKLIKTVKGRGYMIHSPE
ncbi:MAG: response regulator transcription factor [Tannerellaceae bacterium]|nr:response regulator transcription factor [Tannerellaceae bacterium]MCD8264207.1 response regulator transcription factor [Tannerellaceae bacterium]